MFATIEDTVPFRGGLTYIVAVNSAKAATAQLLRESQRNQQTIQQPQTTVAPATQSRVGPANQGN